MGAEVAKHIRWFGQVGLADIVEVGGKNASLGEMVCALEGAGVRVPEGFATTAAAFRERIEECGVERALRSVLDGIDVGDTRSVSYTHLRAHET